MQRKVVIWLCMLTAYAAGFWTVPLFFLWSASTSVAAPATQLSWSPERGWEARCVEGMPPVTLPDAKIAGVTGNLPIQNPQATAGLP